MKKWFKKIVTRTLDWFSSKIYTPRLWSKKEWNKLSSKEKTWIWYKHHDYVMSVGNGELDKILPFLRGEFIATTGIIAVFFNQLGYPAWSYAIYPFIFIGYKLFQWYVGDQIDKRDLVALSSEIGNKREMVFRELRDAVKKEDWRKNV